jgi:hypothetical protein
LKCHECGSLEHPEEEFFEIRDGLTVRLASSRECIAAAMKTFHGERRKRNKGLFVRQRGMTK